MSSRRRAEPLAPEDRRRAIIQAVTPLLIELGPANLTTVRIAEAAGVAEGTIFKVFPDKAALLHEACLHSFDPGDEVEMLRNIERELPLEIKLRKAAAILVDRSRRVYALGAALRSMPTSSRFDHTKTHEAVIAANSRLFDALLELFEGHRSELRVAPDRAAAAFRGLIAAVEFPLVARGEAVHADEAIEILLRGVLEGAR